MSADRFQEGPHIFFSNLQPDPIIVVVNVRFHLDGNGQYDEEKKLSCNYVEVNIEKGFWTIVVPKGQFHGVKGLVVCEVGYEPVVIPTCN